MGSRWEDKPPPPPPSDEDSSGFKIGCLTVVVPVLAILLLLAAGLLSGCSTPEPKTTKVFAPHTGTVSGSLTLPQGGWLAEYEGGPCNGEGGYDDIHPGTQVRVLDSGGKLLQVSSLQTGVIMQDRSCKFAFDVDDVPRGHKLYAVEVSHRGELSYQESRLFGENLEMSLG